MRNFLAEMLEKLTSPYVMSDRYNAKNGLTPETNIGKLFSVLAYGLDTVQKQAETIKLWDNIDNANGSVLDRYGANFGVKRMGATDTFYRLAIKVKMLSQLSGGDINTVINAASALMDLPPDRIDLTEIFPAKIDIGVNERELSKEVFDAIEEITALLKRIVLAGVWFVTTLRVYRQMDGETLIETAAFDHTGLQFDLPDVDRRLDGDVPVTTALFDTSQLKFDLPDVNRKFIEDILTRTGVFARAEIRFDLPDARRKIVSDDAQFRTAAFARTVLQFKPPDVRREIASESTYKSALFEHTRIVTNPV